MSGNSRAGGAASRRITSGNSSPPTYLDQEHGFLDLRDTERTAYATHTTRMANFDAARYLCQWSRLAKTVQMPVGSARSTVALPSPSGAHAG